jgi:hypothetical protein
LWPTAILQLLFIGKSGHDTAAIFAVRQDKIKRTKINRAPLMVRRRFIAFILLLLRKVNFLAFFIHKKCPDEVLQVIAPGVSLYHNTGFNLSKYSLSKFIEIQR